MKWYSSSISIMLQSKHFLFSRGIYHYVFLFLLPVNVRITFRITSQKNLGRVGAIFIFLFYFYLLFFLLLLLKNRK